MSSLLATQSPAHSAGGASEVSLPRLYALRAVYLIFVVGGFVVHPEWMLAAPSLTDRGMIEGVTAGLWLMSFIGLRYPLQMLPIFLFECVWKTIWVLWFGLPQYLAGRVGAQFSEDLMLIGAGAVVFGLVIPWGYVWRHYVKQSGDRWR